jgi:toxin ParE1/3/4
MAYSVELTAQAYIDLKQIIEYFSVKVDLVFAEKILLKIEQAIDSLSYQPTRGHKPHELYKMSTAKQLEITVDKIPIIYEIQENSVFMTAIFDGRQNVQAHRLKRIHKLH